MNAVAAIRLDEVTERWGVKVTTVEVREVNPPKDVLDAMTRQMSAERTRRAAIHRDLGKGTMPLSWCLLGGKSLHAGKEFIICYVTPEQVPQVAEALDKLNPIGSSAVIQACNPAATPGRSTTRISNTPGIISLAWPISTVRPPLRIGQSFL